MKKQNVFEMNLADKVIFFMGEKVRLTGSFEVVYGKPFFVGRYTDKKVESRKGPVVLIAQRDVENNLGVN